MANFMLTEDIIREKLFPFMINRYTSWTGMEIYECRFPTVCTTYGDKETLEKILIDDLLRYISSRELLRSILSEVVCRPNLVDIIPFNVGPLGGDRPFTNFGERLDYVLPLFEQYLFE